MKKRLMIPLMLVLCLCVLFLAGTAMAADNPAISFISYNENGVSQGEQTCTDYQLLTNSSASWYDINANNGGWYVAQGNVTMSSDTTLRITGEVHLILCDGAKLTVGDGVYIKKGSSLSIYGQSGGTGKLIAKPDSGPGIGGMSNTVAGNLYIHGGIIEAKGGTNAAGIGGGNHSSGYQNIVIYGGKVTATGGSSGAGIGKGQQNSPSDCGLIAIYGGVVTASSVKYGAGIGGGEDRDGGTIRIYGGTVTADGGQDGAGIGGGEGGSGGNILIAGGTVTATGGDYGAGIGGGEGGQGGTIAIQNGTVKATGGNQAAGIGGGKTSGNELIGWNYGRGGSIQIIDGSVEAKGGNGAAGIGGGYLARGESFVMDGGNVKAVGGKDGAGIGGGLDGSGGVITINGGTVTVSWDEQGHKSSFALGRGYNETYQDDQLGKGTLTLYPGAKVNQVTFGKRILTCQSHTNITIVPCGHTEFMYSATKSGHTIVCNFCEAEFAEEPHSFQSNEVCDICKYDQALVSITFRPGDLKATGNMEAVSYVPRSVHYIPDCDFVKDGYEFAGWQLNETDIILPAGQEYMMDANITLTATWRNNWSDLQAEIDAAESGAVIRLDGLTVASIYDSALTVSSGKTITLDLNGCTLSRGLTEGQAGGQVIINNGTLTITDSIGDGVITGGYGASGSDGGAIVNNGMLTLAGGTITGNRAVNSAGAVLNKSGATFTMNGGSISGNTSGGGGGGAVVNYGTMTLSGGSITGNTSRANGGGIWSNGTLNIRGGSITENTASDKGGGIYANGTGTLTLSGLVVITGNSTTGRGVNNLHINRDNNTLITVGELGEKSQVGVSCSDTPMSDASVAIITGATGEIPQIFSDSNKYILTYKSSIGRLYLALAPTYAVIMATGVEHGTVTANPARGNEGDTVTLTANPEENYILESLTMTPAGGETKTILPDGETGAYRFILPAANVTIGASFVQDKTGAKVQLVWDDGDSASGRPDSVRVTLLDLLEPVSSVEVTASNGWTTTQNGLPMDHNGELASYSWTIQDSDLPAGYSLKDSTVTGEIVSGSVSTLTLTPAQPVTLVESGNGTVTASKREAAEGETVILTVTPMEDYRLQDLTCTAGNEVLSLTFDAETDTYAFAMPAQTVTVTAVFEKIPTDWQVLQALIDAAPERGIITLTQDYTGKAEDVSLHVISGRKVTIDLDGFGIIGGAFEGRVFTVNGGELTIEGSGTITGGDAANSVGGAFIVQGGGKLTLNGGTVSNNKANNGGGAVAVTNGTFVMNGGEISQNSTEGTGGGVRVQGGTFVMNGGIIRSNTASGNGGGLWVGEGSTVRITGGTLGNNNASLGYDVYLNGVGMSISGSPAIDQAYVYNTVISVNGTLNQGARIGLTCSNSAARNGTVLTSGLAGNGVLAHFPSVKKDYVSALNADGEVYLASASIFGTPDFTLPSGVATIEANAFEGAAMAVVSIPDGCESIGDYAFKDCLHLKQIRIPTGCALGKDVFNGCGTVYVFGTAGSAAETYCAGHDNCVFVAE